MKTRNNSSFMYKFFYLFGAYMFGQYLGAIIYAISKDPDKVKLLIKKCTGVVKKTAQRLVALAK